MPHIGQHDKPAYPIILLDAGQQRCTFLRLLLAEGDAVVGDAAIEILPELLVELRIVATAKNFQSEGIQAVLSVPPCALQVDQA